MDVTVNGVRLHVEGRGTGGPTLVFLHYFGGSSRTWLPVMDRLSGHFRCVAPDLRGWGASEAPASGYAVEDMAGDVAGLVSSLGLSRYVLVGHSMGGKAVLALAARHPVGLEALLLVAPSPPSPEPMADAERARLLAGWGSRESALETLEKITARPLSPALTEQAAADALRASRPAWDAWLQAGSREDITDRAGQIVVPTHILAGQEDSGMTPDLLRREVQARIGGADLSVIPGAGHLLPLEAPEAVADWIQDRLQPSRAAA